MRFQREGMQRPPNLGGKKPLTLHSGKKKTRMERGTDAITEMRVSLDAAAKVDLQDDSDTLKRTNNSAAVNMCISFGC